MKITIAQLNPVVGDIAGNVRKILDAWRQAKDAGADLVVTQEMSITGYPLEDLVEDPDLLGSVSEALEQIRAVTATGGPGLIVGGPEKIDAEKKIFNSAFVFENGQRLNTIRKHNLPNTSVFYELRNFAAAELGDVVTFRGRRLGLMICEDTWHPEVAKNLKEKGAEILISINGSPYYAGKQSVRLAEVAGKRIKETGLPLIYVNQVGGQDELPFDGASFVVMPDDGTGKLVYQAPAWKEHVETLSFDEKFQLLTSVRLGEAAAAPKIYPRDDRLSDTYNALVVGTRDYVKKTGFERVVLGLSGGIDSALVAAIAVDALGADKVHCVRLPSRFTSDLSMSTAQDIATNLGCRLHTSPIEAIADTLRDELAKLFTESASDLTDQNIQARARGVILMAFTNQHPRTMLLTTGNKSEVAVGYCTLYGDMCGGFNPLKDVYKTTVFDLSRWRNKNKPELGLGPSGLVIPESVITRPPSAELKADQKDEDSLPPYPILDGILRLHIENRLSRAEIIAKGYDEKTVDRVIHLVKINEYKRRQAPPGVIITPRAFSYFDRRMPIINLFCVTKREGK